MTNGHCGHIASSTPSADAGLEPRRTGYRISVPMIAQVPAPNPCAAGLGRKRIPRQRPAKDATISSRRSIAKPPPGLHCLSHPSILPSQPQVPRLPLRRRICIGSTADAADGRVPDQCRSVAQPTGHRRSFAGADSDRPNIAERSPRSGMDPHNVSAGGRQGSEPVRSGSATSE